MAPTQHNPTTLPERLLDTAEQLRALALELLEKSTGRDFDARVSALLDRMIRDLEAHR